jgi:hypothetical protein
MRGGFVWDPAGADHTLAQARTELRAGRRGLARDALAQCRGDAAVRAQRSLLLGSVVAGTDLAETWVTEDPRDPDARLLYARVAMVRAQRAARAGDPREAALGALAWQAALSASRYAPADPTPWATLLAVARHRPPPAPGAARPRAAAAPPGLRFDGPWDLLAETQARRPWHREAFLRLLAYFFPRHGVDADVLWQVVSWAADASPADSDPQLLPLAARAELARAPTGAAGHEPSEEYAAYVAATVYTDWFPGISQLSYPPVADLSLLAHALDRGGLYPEAGEVLAAMRPYATAFPWSLDGDPTEALRAAYARSRIRPP